MKGCFAFNKKIYESIVKKSETDVKGALFDLFEYIKYGLYNEVRKDMSEADQYKYQKIFNTRIITYAKKTDSIFGSDCDFKWLKGIGVKGEQVADNTEDVEKLKKEIEKLKKDYENELKIADINYYNLKQDYDNEVKKNEELLKKQENGGSNDEVKKMREECDLRIKCADNNYNKVMKDYEDKEKQYNELLKKYEPDKFAEQEQERQKREEQILASIGIKL